MHLVLIAHVVVEPGPVPSPDGEGAAAEDTEHLLAGGHGGDWGKGPDRELKEKRKVTIQSGNIFKVIFNDMKWISLTFHITLISRSQILE